MGSDDRERGEELTVREELLEAFKAWEQDKENRISVRSMVEVDLCGRRFYIADQEVRTFLTQEQRRSFGVRDIHHLVQYAGKCSADEIAERLREDLDDTAGEAEEE